MVNYFVCRWFDNCLINVLKKLTNVNKIAEIYKTMTHCWKHIHTKSKVVDGRVDSSDLKLGIAYTNQKLNWVHKIKSTFKLSFALICFSLLSLFNSCKEATMWIWGKEGGVRESKYLTRYWGIYYTTSADWLQSPVERPKEPLYRS